nr:hypothetical protein [Tanacetum cinerariifolium]
MVDLMSQMQKVLHERPQGALLSNTEPNPREQVNSITTRSGLNTTEPSIPPPVPPNPRVEVEKEPKTLMDEVPEKLDDPGKFLIPCVLQDLESRGSNTSHFDDFLPAYEAFCFDIEEKSSGSTTSQFDNSLSKYESFCFDVNHIEEKSNGRTTSHSDLSLPAYKSFHFDLLIDPLPPADKSDSRHEEFADKLAHIISPPEYDHFYFDLEADPGELTRLLKENISETSTKDLKINKLNDSPLFLSYCDSFFDKFSEIDLLVLFPLENKEKVFDPEIFTINGVHSKRFSILILDDFSSILFVRDFLSTTNPSGIDTFFHFPPEMKTKFSISGSS